MESSAVDVVGTVLSIYTPWLSRNTRAIVMSLITNRGVFTSAGRFASKVGARNRHQVAYFLRKAGLPPLQRLAGWIRVMFWVVEYEANGRTICRSSLEQARDPSYRYRLVVRLTGQPWTKVKKLGLAWLLEEFLKICSPPSVSVKDGRIRVIQSA